jgi:hypothetical protein
MNPISSAASGLIAASNSFDQASVALSNAASGNGDIASAITDQIGAKIQFEAEAKVMQSIQKTQQQALDILV